MQDASAKPIMMLVSKWAMGKINSKKKKGKVARQWERKIDKVATITSQLSIVISAGITYLSMTKRVPCCWTSSFSAIFNSSLLG